MAGTFDDFLQALIEGRIPQQADQADLDAFHARQLAHLKRMLNADPLFDPQRRDRTDPDERPRGAYFEHIHTLDAVGRGECVAGPGTADADGLPVMALHCADPRCQARFAFAATPEAVALLHDEVCAMLRGVPHDQPADYTGPSSVDGEDDKQT